MDLRKFHSEQGWLPCAKGLDHTSVQPKADNATWHVSTHSAFQGLTTWNITRNTRAGLYRRLGQEGGRGGWGGRPERGKDGRGKERAREGESGRRLFRDASVRLGT